MIQSNVLIALGFRRAQKQRGFSKETWYQPCLELFYDPKMHSDTVFARNLVMAIRAIRLSDETYRVAEYILDRQC